MTYSGAMTAKAPQSVLELPYYRARASTRMTDEEQAAAVLMIGSDPECGALIPGGGGIRKLRFAIGGRGKSGGVRIIYYYHDRGNPIYLLTVFAKNEQANLPKSEINGLAKLVKQLIETYRGEAHGK